MHGIGSMPFGYQDPIFCGGFRNADWNAVTDSCYGLYNETPVYDMTVARGNAASVALNQTHIWITGGHTKWISTPLTSSEFISFQSGVSKPGPDLPKPMEDHCMATINQTHVILVGGLDDDFISDETYIYDLELGLWSDGPKLNQKRRGFGCAASYSGLIVVAGGYSGEYQKGWFLTSVEILIGDQWILGTLNI